MKTRPAVILKLGFWVFAISLLSSCLPTPEIPGRGGVPLPNGVTTELLQFEQEVVADGFIIPWSIEVLGTDEYLVSERMGALVHIKNGQSSTLTGLPETRTFKADRHYGGVMGVSKHPLFERNRLIYVAYVDHDFRMVVARFRFEQDSIQQFEVIFKTNAFSLGSRIEWEDETHFYVSHGIAGTPLPDPGAQDVTNDGGKIHRLNEDGSIPVNNPIFPGQKSPSSIWSLGHRDTQGLFLDQENGVLYANEHGPLGGDELNIITKGGNYGWPRFSYGLNYDGSPVGDLSESEADSLTNLPLMSWDSSFNMAPSGLEQVFFPSVGTRLVWGSLVQQRLIAFDTSTRQTSVLMDDVGRIRDVKQLENGELLILVDAESSIKTNSGRVIKVTLK